MGLNAKILSPVRLWGLLKVSLKHIFQQVPPIENFLNF